MTRPAAAKDIPWRVVYFLQMVIQWTEGIDMKMQYSTLKDIRTAILADAKRFLQCLDSGASVEELAAILAGIKEMESQLIRNEGEMLAPGMWQVLNNRLTSKINRERVREAV